ncbi:kinase-like domain-containing protein [Phellopilus nigrolimitatus]|nr:kinase-like domain-containing protein [Phellopilus nigrolimitatus]
MLWGDQMKSRTHPLSQIGWRTGQLRNISRNLLRFDNFSMIRGIANGLEYLHEQGVIHGDLKAANVLVSPKGAPLLMDFGLSHLVCTTSTVESATSARTGSIRWQSPELLFPPGDSDDDVHTKASDIWAFGMTALEVLTKNIPYQTAKMDTQVIGLIYKGTVPPDPDDLKNWKDIDKALWDFCKRCWLLDPKARPPMRDLLKELKKLKADYPASAHK